MDLPRVVLVHIFKYLNHSDQGAATQTCKSWYDAASTNFMNKLITFENISLNSDETCKLRIFVNSTIKYRKFSFKKVKITAETIYFWNAVGVNITKLAFENCNISNEMLCTILQSCPNIHELDMKCQNLTSSPSASTKQMVTLDKLKVLKILGNSCLCLKLFLDMFDKKPALKLFHIIIFSRLQKVDEPNNLKLQMITTLISSNQNLQSESPIEFESALKIITSSAKTLKSLLYCSPYMTGKNLGQILEVKELQLLSLQINCANLSDPVGVQAISNHQTSLKELNLSVCNHFTDEGLNMICRKLNDLECLNILRTTVTDIGVIEIKKLKLLKSLSVAHCTVLTKTSLEKGICAENNTTLKELDISRTNLGEDSIFLVSERLSLVFLDVSYCDGINDKTIKALIKSQVNLHTLKMANVNVSDKGLTDPRCPIASLINLRELDIRNGFKITDVSLRSFKFQYLCKLDISMFEGFLNFSFLANKDGKTPYGLRGIVQGCPTLRYLNLMNCPKLKKDEVAVREIVKALPNLKLLQL